LPNAITHLTDSWSRLRCSRLERLLKYKKMFFVFKTHQANQCVVNFYIAGVVNRGRRFGSWS
jgi:hypothetical protein